MLVAQFTDTHLVPPGRRHHFLVDTAAALERAVEGVNALEPRPDIVVVTGDVADRGLPVEYARAHGILRELAMPYHVLPGNHDDPAALARAFGAHPPVHAIEGFPVRIVALDSTLPKQSAGSLDTARLARLDAVLAGDRRPTLIVMHHPPLRTGVHYLDALGFVGAPELGALVSRHPHVRRILCGHIHRQVDLPWHGTVVSTSISTAPQFVPELFMRRPIGLTREKPGFRLYAWDGTGLQARTVVTEPVPGLRTA